MPLILPVKNVYPKWGKESFIADNATIVGDVLMGDNCSVWFNAVVRGDVNSIAIGNNVNIQDGVVIHCSYLGADTKIGNDVSIGHNAIIHGCQLRDHVLIGMGSIVMDNAVVEEYCIIGAGSLVLENTLCESGYIYAGSPAKKIKPISQAQRELLERLPKNYILYSSWFTEG